MRIAIACVLKTGGDFNEEYVERLYQGIKSFSLLPFFHFIVLTNSRKKFSEGIRPVFMQHAEDLHGWWAQVELFRPDVFRGYDRVVYFDLDTVIWRDIGFLTSYPGKFASLGRTGGHEHRGRIATGVMVWQPSKMGYLWDFYKDNQEKFAKYMKPPIEGVDKSVALNFFEPGLKKWDDLHKLYPGKITNYKNNCLKKKIVPEDSSVVCFHCKPRPRDVGWLDEWRKKE